jgi:hypothetical protein
MVLTRHMFANCPNQCNLFWSIYELYVGHLFCILKKWFYYIAIAIDIDIDIDAIAILLPILVARI